MDAAAVVHHPRARRRLVRDADLLERRQPDPQRRSSAIVSALLILVDFNYLRKHGTKDDAVWLATGIFVSIINIFLSLLNILDN